MKQLCPAHYAPRPTPRLAYLFLCALVLFSTALCAEPILAIAGPDTLYRRDLELQLAIQGGGEITPDNIGVVLDNWIDNSLLYREALRRGIGNDETTLAVIAEAERQYLITLITRRITDTVRATDNQIFDYYNRRKLDFATQLRFQYMVLPDLKTARQTLKDLSRGKPFKALASERSLERAANPNAEMTLAHRGDTANLLDLALEDTLFILPENKVSGPIKVGSTWWLVQPLAKTRCGEPPPLQSAQGYIAQFLDLRNRRIAIDRTLAELRKKTRVTLTAPRGDTTGFLAAVGDRVLTRRYLELQLEGKAQLNKEDLPRLLDIWTKSELLYQEALRLKVGNDETTQVMFRDKQREYLRGALIDRLLKPIIVPQTEVFDYFQQHQDEYLYSVRILHILTASDSIARQLLGQVKKGADFATLARERSLDRVAIQGNESPVLDRLDPNLSIGPALEQTIFQMKLGEVSPVIHTPQGYWLVKVTDRKKVRNSITFEQAKDRIQRFLFQQRSRQLLDNLLRDLRAQTAIQLFPDNYWN